MGATGPPHPVAGRPPGWRGSHPPGTRWYASGCRTGRHALGWPGPDAECCGRAAGPQPLTLRPPRPRKTAAASAASMTGTSRIARILTPGACVDPAPLAARPSRLRRVSRLSQDRSGHDRDSSCSSRGICWLLVSFVNVANIDLRRGSSACSECSIRPRTRCWRAGRLIKSAPHPVSRRGWIVDEGECAPGRVLNRDHEAHAVRPAAREWLAGVFEGDRVHVAAVLVGTYFHHPALDRGHVVRVGHVCDRHGHARMAAHVFGLPNRIRGAYEDVIRSEEHTSELQ